MSENRENENIEVRVLIEELKGDIKLLVDRVEFLVKSVDKLTVTTVTREELKLTIEPLDERIKLLETFKDTVVKSLVSILSLIGIALFGYLLSKAIPGFSL